MRKILIADDDDGILGILKLLLEHNGYETITAYNGREALDKTAAFRPDLVLLDIMMPEIHGISVCRQIKSNAQLRDTKVVMCSVKSFPEDRREAKEAGADGFIGKPCDAPTLIENIEFALNN
jgi:two-component system, OmpR family, alkaline phosphatase synthesis response regulator PhoP